MKNNQLLTLLLTICFMTTTSITAFQSDELLIDDEEFIGIEGASSSSQRSSSDSSTYTTRSSPTPSTTNRRNKFPDPDSDSKIQFTLEHAFGDSDFFPAGTFSARLKTWSHGSQTLTKLRFSRNTLTDVDKENFEKLLTGDEFYKIRLPSNVLSPPGRDYVVSSVKARCLPREGLDEHFVIHME